jgi:hypothetical protein
VAVDQTRPWLGLGPVCSVYMTVSVVDEAIRTSFWSEANPISGCAFVIRAAIL